MQQAIQECARCDNPQGGIVILNNREPVCGACVASMGQMAKIAERIPLNFTPSAECIG